MSAFPHRTEVEHQQRSHERIRLGGSERTEMLEALGSETAREILCALQAEPATASGLAEARETSLQNVQYHLDRLSAAGLIESVDTWYSVRGRRMAVYAPTVERLVIEFDDASTAAPTSAGTD